MRLLLWRELLALAQFIVAVLMFRSLVFKRGTGELMMPGIGFLIMSTVLKMREIRGKPEKILHRMDILKGQTILDYGCGIGSFSTLIAKIIPNTGKNPAKGNDDIAGNGDSKKRMVDCDEMHKGSKFSRVLSYVT